MHPAGRGDTECALGETHDIGQHAAKGPSENDLRAT
jgi:hypothetical protein